jgi:hypothetical protein
MTPDGLAIGGGCYPHCRYKQFGISNFFRFKNSIEGRAFLFFPRLRSLYEANNLMFLTFFFKIKSLLKSPIKLKGGY